MTDREAYRIIEEPAEKYGFINQINYSEMGKYVFKCSMKFEKEEFALKVESKFYNVDDCKMDYHFDSSKFKSSETTLQNARGKMIK